MEKEEFEQIISDVQEKIKSHFGDKACGYEILDVADAPGYWAFGIRFVAYQYYAVCFSYHLDLISFSIVSGAGTQIRLTNTMDSYSEGKIDSLLESIIEEIELRIPDKYLEVKGWK